MAKKLSLNELAMLCYRQAQQEDVLLQMAEITSIPILVLEKIFSMFERSTRPES